MATGSRTLKLSILGDVSDLNKSLKSANSDVESFGDKLGDFGKKAALAFAVAGAAAAKFAFDAIKNAAADEAAQRTLAKTIENTTGATKDQISAVEEWITATSLAKGITDDVLRPAFARLTRSTKDVEESQKLLNLALDISSATGKPLEAIANSLGKAYDGNTNALGKLGLGLDQNIIKSKDFDAVYNSLRGTFKGFAEQEANTLEGKMRRVQIAFDEAKETIGAALLPVMEKLANFIIESVVPAVNSFVAGLTGKGEDSLTSSLTQTQETALQWGKRIKGLISTVIEFKDELIVLGITLGTIFAIGAIAGWVSATVAAVKTIIIAYNALKASAIVAGVASAFALNPLLGVGAVALAAGVLSAAVALSNRYSTDVPTDVESGFSEIMNSQKAGQIVSGSSSSGNFTPSSVSGGPTSGGGSAAASVAAAVSSALPSGIKYPSAPNLTSSEALFSSLTGTSGNFPGTRVSPFLAQSPNISITVNGALDSESTARQIVQILNDSQARGTQGASALITTPGGMGF